MDLSIVVPVYNERLLISPVLSRLRAALSRAGFSSQVIVVDDGSADGTSEWLAANTAPPFETVFLPENRGKTHAVREGLKRARGTWVVIQDADLEYDPSEIPRLMEAADQSGACAVYGRRPNCWQMPSRWTLATGVLIIDISIWLSHGRFVRDHASCYKLVRRDVLDQLELVADGFEGCVEMTCKLIRRGYDIEQVPISYSPRSHHEGKKLTWRHGWRALHEVWRCRQESAAGAPARGDGTSASNPGELQAATLVHDRKDAAEVAPDPRDEKAESRSGFTLVELVVTIGIISILIALAMPAVQYAREISRRTQCSNRLKQIGLAFQNFQSAHRLFPSNGGAMPGNGLTAVDGTWVRPATTEFPRGIRRVWGVGSPKYGPKNQPGPWCYSLFPQLELQRLRPEGTYADHVPQFVCPSRSRSPALPPEIDEHGMYESGGHAMAKTDYAANHRLILDRPNEIDPSEISDGLSQTILVGEKAFDPGVQVPSSWHWDEPIWIGGSKGTARAAAKIVPDGFGIHFEDNWGSPHPSGIHYVFADGHVSRFTFSMDTGILHALLTPAGRESVTIPE